MLQTLIVLAALAGPEDFHPGSRVIGYGKIAEIPGAPALPKNLEYSVLFDVSEAAEPGKSSRRIEAAARLLNMYAAAKVPDENARVAIIVHGKAHRDVLQGSGSAGLVAALIKAGARVELCGQTATYYDVDPKTLVPGVRLGISAMTTHAVLLRQGYTLNPF